MFGISAAVTYIVSVNDAEAHIGQTGNVTVHGNLIIEGTMAGTQSSGMMLA